MVNFYRDKWIWIIYKCELNYAYLYSRLHWNLRNTILDHLKSVVLRRIIQTFGLFAMPVVNVTVDIAIWKCLDCLCNFDTSLFETLKVLVTKADFQHDYTRSNLRATLTELLRMKIIPIVNANDVIAPPPEADMDLHGVRSPGVRQRPLTYLLHIHASCIAIILHAGKQY